MSVSEAHILIIGDSANDFPISYQETTQLASDLRQKGYPVLDLYRGDATAENILKGMYSADAVIYAGHGGYQSGHYNGAGGTASPPFALVGSDEFIWGIGSQMREGWDSDLFTAPFKEGIPVFLLHSCFSTGWVESYQVANPVETIYNFAQMFNGAGANYYATAWNGAEIIYDFLNGATNFQAANNQNYEKITTSTLYNNVPVWRNNNGYAAFVGDWNGQFPSVNQTTAYDESAADAWYHGNRVISESLYANANLGNDSWDGTSSTFMGGTKGPMKTITATLNALPSWKTGTIHVSSGTYTENLVINQKIYLLGSGVNTIITPSNLQKPIINITSGGNGSLISGFILQGASLSSAVDISGASSCTITNNNITGNKIGILISGSNNTVSSNNISGNRDGVYLANKTEGNIVTGNQINNSGSNGVYCEGGNNQTIKNNTITQGSSGVTVYNSKNVKIEDNQINNNMGTGVSLENSNNTTIQRNNISNNQDGIEISENSQYNTVADNEINNNQNTGISIQKSHNNYITHNSIQNNSETGIKLNQSTGNTINNVNTIRGSNVGIDLQDHSNYNTITGNTIFANTLLINSSNSSGNTINNNQVNLFSINPANNAVNVASNKVITVTFSDAVKLGNLNLVLLKNSSGTIIPSTKSIGENILTITPTSPLAEDKYLLLFYAGFVTDLAGNMVESKTSNFIVGTSPTVTSMDPANYAVNIAANKVITVTFNEAIKFGNNNIQLKTSTGTLIPINKIISGNVLTITPINPLTEARYMLIIYAGSVTDLVGNPVAAKTTSFSVGTSPNVTNTNPANYAVNVARNKVITVTFNEPILAKYLTLVYLKTTAGVIIATNKSVSGNVLTITPTNTLAAGTRYLLMIYNFAVTDLSGNPNINKAISFTTGTT